MSNTFKPGDRVRRTGESWPSEGMVHGEEYVVVEQTAIRAIKVEGRDYTYDPALFELVTPAPIEFQVGDRVRATSKTTDDTATFTVIYVEPSGSMESHHNYFSRVEWDFELLSRPEPPKPPLPTKLGSVVRIIEFGGYPEDYIGLLTSGGWMLHPDDKPYKSVSVFESFDPVFEVIYEPDN